MANYKLVFEGTYVTKGAYEFKAAAPLDTRSVVPNLKSLISATVWENNGEYVYDGLSVYVEGTHETYQLFSKTDLKTHLFSDSDLDNMSDATAKANIETCWEKNATISDISKTVQDLGPVFKFQGVAQAISEDETTLTVDKMSFTPTGETTPLDLICLGYDHGFPKLYYSWGTIDASTSDRTVYFHTDTPDVSTGSQQYKKGTTATVIYYVDDASLSSKRYYFDGSVANADAKSDDTVLWQFTDEADLSHLYCAATSGANEPSADETDKLFYLEPDTSKDVYAKLNIVHFDSYKFTKKTAGTINSNTGSAIVADNKNNGHVYQIKEEEYASNGLTWVQLGSPDNEWVVI